MVDLSEWLAQQSPAVVVFVVFGGIALLILAVILRVLYGLGRGAREQERIYEEERRRRRSGG